MSDIRTCDLHTHSTSSDGTFTPTELLREAERCGLSAIALTDHNTVAGLPEFTEAAKGMAVEAVPGIEISTDWEDTEFHLVGLYLREEHYPTIYRMLADLAERKKRSNIALTEALTAAGYPLSYEALVEAAGGGQINRAHIAMALIEAGYAEDIADAFRRFLHVRNGYYCPPARPGTLDMIDMLHSMGAVSILAHPLLSVSGERLAEFLRIARSHGLDGIETHYVTYSPEEVALSQRIAEEAGLLESGGSDFHGAREPDISLGTGRGGLAVPYAFLEAIRVRRDEYVSKT